jgi:hypothetical protein
MVRSEGRTFSLRETGSGVAGDPGACSPDERSEGDGDFLGSRSWLALPRGSGIAAPSFSTRRLEVGRGPQRELRLGLGQLLPGYSISPASVALWWLSGCATVLPEDSRPEAAAPQAIPDTPHHVDLPSVGIRLQKPEGFEVSPDFPGLMQEETRASVMVTVMPGSFSEASAGYTAEGVAAHGLTLLGREERSIAGQSGLLVHLAQTAYGLEFEKWSALFGDEQSMTVVTASFPKERAETLSPLLREVVLGAERSGPPAPQNLPFAVAASEKLKPTTGMTGGLMLTRTGTLGEREPGEPIFLVTRSVSPVPVTDWRQYAAQRLMETATVTIRQLDPAVPVTIDGLEGFEMTAEAEHTKSKVPVAVYQVLLFDAESYYYLAVGMVGADQQREYLPEFRALAKSLRRTSPARP